MTAEITAPAASTDHAAELIAAVREHATAHSSEGWDVITEAITDAELAEIIGTSRTPKSAIAKAAKVVKLRAEQQAAVDSQVTGEPAAKPEQPKPPTTSARKRIVAEAVIKAATELAAGWEHDEITRDEAAALISACMNYIPGGIWDDRLGERSGAGRRNAK